MIRHFVIVSVSLVALTAAASAADMYRAPDTVSYKDTPYIEPSWAGWYAGVNGGYAWDADPQNILLTATPPLGGYPATTSGTNASGGFGGGQIGYNWQLPGGLKDGPSHWVLGLETDIQGAGVDGSVGSKVINGFGDAVSAKKELDYFGTVRGRVGYAFGNTLLYGTGGFAYGGVKNRVFDNLAVIPPLGTVTMERSATEAGYVVGAGVEYLIAPRWTLKAEYQYIDLGSYNLSSTEVPPSGFTFTAGKLENTFNTVRVGVNYHFGSIYEPLK